MPPVNVKPKRESAKAPQKSDDAPAPVYPEFKARVFGPDAPLDFETAKQLLGWEEVPLGGGKHTLVDETGKKVRFRNSTRNRPFTAELSRQYAQDLLRGHWKLNGETVIVGQSGEVISGQHRLAGVVLAEQIRTGPQAEHWTDQGLTGPVGMPTVVIFGAAEDDDTVNTVDTGRARSPADMLYRCHLFTSFPASERRTLARMTDHAVRIIWDRTGADQDAFAPRKTHSELMSFIDRHPKLVSCVKHIFTENTEGVISSHISPGYAAGMMYLMGVSASDPAKYKKDDPREEKSLKFTHWDKANDFWVLFGTSDNFKPVRTARSPYDTTDERGKKVVMERFPMSSDSTLNERVAVLCKAWAAFAAGEPISLKTVELAYLVNEDGVPNLVERPTVGGIDMGPGGEGDGDDATDGEDPTPEQIEERKPKPAPEPKEEPSGDDAIKAMEDMRKKHPGRFLAYKQKAGDGYKALGADAGTVAKLMPKIRVGTAAGVHFALIPPLQWDDLLPKLWKAGHKVSTVSRAFGSGAMVVKDLTPPAEPPAKGKSGKK